ncbi:MAG: hypothetical protein RLY31_2063 [Bacteroidota bacterium]
MSRNGHLLLPIISLMNRLTSDIHPSNELSLRQIIGQPEGWWLHWGTAIILVALLGMVLLGSLVSYPLIVEAEAMVTTAHPAVAVLAPREGTVRSVLKNHGDTVRAGERLLLLDDPADPDAVLFLRSQLDAFPWSDQEARHRFGLTGLHLSGSLAPVVAAFESAHTHLLSLEQQSVDAERLRNLQQREVILRNTATAIRDQLDVASEQTKLFREMAERDSLLYGKGAGSRTEYEQSRQWYLDALRSAANLRSQAEANHLALAELAAERLESAHSASERLRSAMLDLREKHRCLLGALDEWLDRNTLTAPVDGRLEWDLPLYAKLPVADKTTLFRVVPANAAPSFHAFAHLPHDRIGKVVPGLPARLRLDGYPFEEYGECIGTVEMVSETPGDAGYLIRISLPNRRPGTEGGFTLSPGLKGKVRILTDRSSLLAQLTRTGKAVVASYHWAE